MKLRLLFYIMAFVIMAVIGTVCLMDTFFLQIFCCFCLTTVLFLLLACAVRHTVFTYIFIVFCSLFFSLSVLEWHFYNMGIEKAQKKITITPSLTAINPAVGYALIPDRKVRAVQTYATDTIIYDVSYTIDDKGHRITPDAPHAKTAVVLLGCSFTFGEGLNDDETFPWQLGEALGNDYQVINLAVSGYGPHNALALLEDMYSSGTSSYALDTKNYDRVLVYYTFIDDQIRRPAGLGRWDRPGPRYVFENNEIVRKGSFADRQRFFWESAFRPYIEKSFFLKVLETAFWETCVPQNSYEYCLSLTCAIFEKIPQRVKELYPQSSFTLLLYPSNILNLSLSKNVASRDMKPWFPNYATEAGTYEILGDGHPNALANSIIAKHLASIVKKDAASLP